MENESQDYDSMSVEELGKIVPQQAPPNIEQKTEEPAISATNEADIPTESVQKSEGALEPKSNDTIQLLEKRLEVAEKLMEGLNRQSRQWQAIQGKVDELKAALTQRETKTALTPSELEQKSAQEAAEKFLDERIEQRAKALIEREYGALISPIREQQLNKAIEGQVSALGIEWKEMEPILMGIVSQDSKLAENGDAGAKQRLIALASGNTGNLVLRGMMERSKKLSEKGAQVQKADANRDPGSRLVKTSQQPTPSSKKKVEEMSPDELDSMDLQELEKALPRQRSVRG